MIPHLTGIALVAALEVRKRAGKLLQCCSLPISRCRRAFAAPAPYCRF
jgi:hypothetical protein